MAPSHCTTLLRVTSPWRESSEARWLASLSCRLVGEPSRGAERVYIERLVIAIVARQAERRVGVEAREGRNMTGARARALALRVAEWGDSLSNRSKDRGRKGLETPSEGRDNGSNELTRTPEPRLSLSSPVPCSRSIIVFLLSPSLSRLPFPLSFPRRSYSTAKLPVLFLLYFHYHRRVESNPPSLLSAFRTFLSLSLFLFPSLSSLPRFPILRPVPLALSFLLQGRFRGSQLPGASVLSIRE